MNKCSSCSLIKSLYWLISFTFLKTQYLFTNRLPLYLTECNFVVCGEGDKATPSCRHLVHSFVFRHVTEYSLGKKKRLKSLRSGLDYTKMHFRLNAQHMSHLTVAVDSYDECAPQGH